MITTLIADNQVLTRRGITSILSSVSDINVVGQAATIAELQQMILKYNADVIIIGHFNIDDLKKLGEEFDFSHTLVLSNKKQKDEIQAILGLGIKIYVSKECTQDELITAVYAAASGEQFFCRKTSRTLAESREDSIQADASPLLSVRETEIIQLIAAGMTNKEIAGQLFLSIHTIKTHRKNIIKKLGFTFKNAADLMMYTHKTNESM